eukprot:5119362-Pyramimonas_sp.AAC.1
MTRATSTGSSTYYLGMWRGLLGRMSTILPSSWRRRYNGAYFYSRSLASLVNEFITHPTATRCSHSLQDRGSDGRRSSCMRSWLIRLFLILFNRWEGLAA